MHRPATEPTLEEVDACAREAGVRRAEEREQLLARAAEPREAQEREEGVPERGLRDAWPLLERVRDTERAEDGLERRAPALERIADDRDRVGRGAAADQLEELLGHELERAARARSLEEADRPLEVRRLVARLLEERALEVRERGRVGAGAGGGRQLLDPPVGEAREVLGRPAQRGKGHAARLVRQRDAHLRATGERLEERPLGAGQVLEAVREDRPPAPRGEVGREPLGGTAAQHVAVPRGETVELAPVPRVQLPEVALAIVRLDERRLELAERGEQRVAEPAEPCGAAETVQLRLGDRAADDERPLRVGEQPAALRIAGGDLDEEVVERADRAREQRAGPRQQLALDPLDVRPARHDQERLAVEDGEVAVEEQLDLPGVRGPDDEAQGHRSIVVRP